jgi:molybdopterin-guanine dinucleotide biosynthesis protein
MRIIGIFGAKRSGKDTTAEILAKKLEAMGVEE